ncbi:MAG: hypothetical protein IJU81_01110 [Bacteroidales bacterium]|nr:hypothetical protein [Bacteroidales bacterium]
MTREEYRNILARYMPQAAVDGVYDILDSNRVFLHITRERKSKLGDYQWPRSGHNYHEISVNGDLNKYFFLYVLLHEVAHMDAFLAQDKTHQRFRSARAMEACSHCRSQKTTNEIKPHGHTWQQCYRQRLMQFVEAGAFPAEVATLVNAYCARIPLNRSIGTRIEAQLRSYNKGYDTKPHITLNELPAGTCFRLVSNPAICFRSVERRRTRWRCLDIDTQREYTVAGHAEVEVCQ